MSSTGFTAETPGQLLRAARLARGCDLAAAHEGTKIPPRLLEALERDEYHQVSDMLYVRSFLRSYADWLELDQERVLELFDQVAGDPAPAGDSRTQVWSEDQVTVRRFGLGVPPLRVLTLAVLGILIIASLVWLLWLRGPGDVQQQGQDEAAMKKAALQRDENVQAAAAMQETAVAQGMEVHAAEAATVGAETRVPEFPAAVAGDSGLRFVGGETFGLVLRMRLPSGADCMVKRDGQRVAMPVVWPAKPVPLPPANLSHGRAYATRDGFVAYWGTGDHFTVTLDDFQGVEIMLNGVLQETQRWRPGQEFVLDFSNLDPDGGRR